MKKKISQRSFSSLQSRQPRVLQQAGLDQTHTLWNHTKCKKPCSRGMFHFPVCICPVMERGGGEVQALRMYVTQCAIF